MECADGRRNAIAVLCVSSITPQSLPLQLPTTPPFHLAKQWQRYLQDPVAVSATRNAEKRPRQHAVPAPAIPLDISERVPKSHNLSCSLHAPNGLGLSGVVLVPGAIKRDEPIVVSGQF